MTRNEKAMGYEDLAIGAALLSPRAAADLCSILTPDKFINPKHGALFGGILALRRDRMPVEERMLLDRLGEAGHLGDGGYWRDEDHALYEVRAYAENCPSPTFSAEWCAEVLSAWTLREMEAVGRSARDEDIPPSEVLKAARAVLVENQRGEGVSWGKLGNFPRRPKARGIATGWSIIDDATVCEGLALGQTSCVKAYTGSGKTTWMLQTAANIARRGKRVAYVTLADMDWTELGERAIKHDCGWSSRPDAPHEIENYAAAENRLNDLDITVYDGAKSPFGGDVRRVRDWFLGLHDRKRFDVLMIDYAQKLVHPGVKGVYDNGVACANEVSWLAATTMTHAVIGSQITEGGPGGRDVTKNGRVWEENASLILSLKLLTEEERAKSKTIPEEYQGYSDLGLARREKNRFGPKLEDQYWLFDTSRARFEEL